MQRENSNEITMYTSEEMMDMYKIAFKAGKENAMTPLMNFFSYLCAIGVSTGICYLILYLYHCFK